MVLEAACIWLAVSSTNAQPISVFMDPDPKIASVGQTFSVGIFADIPANDAIIGWDFTPIFDDSQVQWLGAVTLTPWDPFPGSVDPMGIAGSVGISSPVWGDNVRLATLTFQCLGIGSSVLSIATPDPNGLQGFIKADLSYVDWTVRPGTITQTPAGMPDSGSSLQLFGLSILVLFGLRQLFRVNTGKLA